MMRIEPKPRTPRGVVVAAALVGAFLALAVRPALCANPAARSLDARTRLLQLADARRFDAEAFAALAADRDAVIRATSANVLGELANAAGAPLVVRLTRDSDAGVRAAAAAAAGRLISTMPAGVRAADTLGLELRKLVQDPSAAVRSATAWGVGAAQRTGSDLWLLQRLVRERDPGVQAAILQELWRFPGTLWIKRATTFLSSSDVRVRYAATRSLARSGQRDAAAGLERGSRDRDPLVRMAALDGAVRGQAAALWSELLSGAGDADARVRIAAMLGLEVALQREPGRALPPVVVERVARAVADADPDRVHERVAAIRLAGAAKCCHGALKAALAGNEPWVAGEALAALAESGDPDGDRSVKEWFASHEVPHRLAAVRALVRSAGGKQQLVGALGDAQASVRLAALDALKDDPSPAAAAAVAQRLTDQDPVVRGAAVQALADRGALPPAEELLRLLARERGATPSDAAVALVGALGKPATLPEGTRATLEGLTASPDPVLARVAWRALASHGVARPLPEVKTGEDLAYYRRVAEWAGKPRWIEIVTVRGTLQIVLDTDAAPLACFRLSELADRRFFDNLTIHRVEPDFVVQGGDPRGDGSGGPGYAVRDELSLAPFEAGSVGIALDGPDTGGSQFFVTLTPRPHLIGRYPLVGRLAGGLEAALRLRAGDRIVKTKIGEGTPPAYFPIWYGALDPARLDREIPEWREEREKGQPQAKWLDLLRSAKLRYQLVVAMGTWCGDSREQVPRLQAVLAALGAQSPFDAPQLIGVDRSKSVDAKAFPFGQVELVPTIVVAAGGAEIGRIVETPKSTSVEEDLVRILAQVEGWQLPDE